jgi:hypothetical protein
MNARLLRPSTMTIAGFAGYIATLAVLFSTAAPSHATPISFAFDGAVTAIDKSFNANFDLPFAVAPGDVMTGRLTIDPLTFGSIGNAPSLVLTLGSVVFSATDVPIFAIDNDYLAVGFTIVGPNDSISVDCKQIPGCSAKSTPIPGILLSGITMGVWSRGQDIVHGGENLADVKPWNLLPLRAMGVELSSTAGTGTIDIVSTLGPLRAAPEPTSVFLLTTGIIVLAMAAFGQRLSVVFK